jgi:hypothetical protein
MYNRKNLIKLYSEKAIYKRNPESLTNIVNLGQLLSKTEMRSCQGNLGFVLQNTQDLELLIQANVFGYYENCKSKKRLCSHQQN